MSLLPSPWLTRRTTSRSAEVIDAYPLVGRLRCRSCEALAGCRAYKTCELPGDVGAEVLDGPMSRTRESGVVRRVFAPAGSATARSTSFVTFALTSVSETIVTGVPAPW